MTSSECKRLARQLAALVDQELAPEELSRLEEHAAHCPLCGPLLERSRRVALLLRELPVKEAPQGILEGVWERVLEEGESRLGPVLSRSLRPVQAPTEEVVLEPDEEADAALVEVLSSLPSRKTPVRVDRAVFAALDSFLWSRSRGARVLRMVTTSLAAAASLLLCLGLWWGLPKERVAPRKVAFLIQDESAPPGFWEAPEVLQERIHRTFHGRLGTGEEEEGSKGR